MDLNNNGMENTEGDVCLEPVIEQLLAVTKRKFAEYSREDAEYYNILNALGNERDEAHVHSKIIYWLLRSISSPDGSDDFLRMFLEKIGMDKKYLNENWTAYREKYFDDGRIDFVLEAPDFCAAIEMKIDAADGARQLERYEAYCKRLGKNYLVYYLTLDGKMPSQSSMGNMDRSRLRLISFQDTISEWLKDCMNSVNPDGFKYSFLKQYLAAVDYISKGTDDFTMKDYITDKDSAVAALLIFDALARKLDEVLAAYIKGIKKVVERETGLLCYLDEVTLQGYYTSSKSTYPGFHTEIDSQSSGKTKYCFALKVEVDHLAYVSLGFAKKSDVGQYDWMELEDIKRKCPDFYKKWTERVEALQLPELKRSADSMWFYIKNSQGELFDFKNFGIPVLELLDDLDEQVEFVGGMLVNNVIRKLTTG